MPTVKRDGQRSCHSSTAAIIVRATRGAGVGPGAARLPRELGVGLAGIFGHNFAAFDRDQATERAAWVT
jgi:hypothetical protein